MVLLFAFIRPYPYSGPLQFGPYFLQQTTLIFTQALPTQFITLQINSAGNIPATATCIDLHFHQNSIPPKINIDFSLDRYKVFRGRICTEPGSKQVGSVLVLGAEVVQVGPIQMSGPKQNYSSKHLDRISTGPGSEQLRRLNSLLKKPHHCNKK